jgi:hypothetical protein
LSRNFGDEIQQLVDSLATRIRRSVAVDSADGELIASSRHFGDEDPTRINVVLSRKLDPKAGAYLRSFGIASASAPLSTPPNDQLGLKARRCYPIRKQSHLLGFLWLIDDSTRHDGIVAEYVDQLAEAWQGRSLARVNRDKRIQALVRAAISGTHPSAALLELTHEQLLDENAHLVVFTAWAPQSQGNPPLPSTRAKFPNLDTLPQAKPFTGMLTSQMGPVTAVLIPVNEDQLRPLPGLAAALQTKLVDQTGTRGVVGVSSRGRPVQAPQLFRQSAMAAFLAREQGQEVLEWESAGLFGPLLEATIKDHESVIPNQVRLLQTAPSAEPCGRQLKSFSIWPATLRKRPNASSSTEPPCTTGSKNLKATRASVSNPATTGWHCIWGSNFSASQKAICGLCYRPWTEATFPPNFRR